MAWHAIEDAGPPWILRRIKSGTKLQRKGEAQASQLSAQLYSHSNQPLQPPRNTLSPHTIRVGRRRGAAHIHHAVDTPTPDPRPPLLKPHPLRQLRNHLPLLRLRQHKQEPAPHRPDQSPLPRLHWSARYLPRTASDRVWHQCRRRHEPQEGGLGAPGQARVCERGRCDEADRRRRERDFRAATTCCCRY